MPVGGGVMQTSGKNVAFWLLRVINEEIGEE